jgi:UDP-N-acetylglucosamine--N-acetylmuramyl-(pentapeptide) pyrophosphoryl-undecaprenol N-acetylglucosamine transferase
MTATTRTLLIMAGGTGGHIMPGLAVADAMTGAGWRVVWMGNPNGMEARLVPPRGYEMAWVRFSALRGKGLARILMLPVNLLSAFGQAWRELKRIRPDVVLGLGGYVTFPGGMMAVLRGLPFVVHEQNSIAGLANRVLSRIADAVLSGFPSVLSGAVWVGNPVRAAIAALPEPEERFAGRSGPLHVLVIGGSLGATALNEVVPRALACLPEAFRPVVTHQSGEKHLETLKESYSAAGVKANCVAFIDDMAAAYADVDLVVCRAGALTVAELAAAGVASLLVPFPFAVDDHQSHNAAFLAESGAAIRIAQDELTPAWLAEQLAELDRAALCAMALQARQLARPDAAGRVAEVCMALAKRAAKGHTA